MAALCWACASTPAQAPSPRAAGEAAGLDVEELLRREVEPVARSSLASADGLLRVTVPARPVGHFAAAEENYYLELDIGTEGPIGCWFYPDGLDLAASLGGISAALFDDPQLLGEVELRQITGVDAGAIGDSPYLGIRWLFRSIRAGQPVVGQLNILVANKQARAVACIESELGFDQSFQRVFAELVESLQFGTPAPLPYYEEIAVLEINERRAGVQRVTFTLDEDGDTAIGTTVAMALQTSPTELATSDSYDVQFSTDGGAVISQSSWEVENGVLTTELFLARETSESWLVSGSYHEKEIEVTIEAGNLASTLFQTRALRTALAEEGAGASLAFPSWIAGADPSRLLMATTDVVEQLPAGEFRVQLAVGPMTAEGIVDESASLKTGQMQVGPMTVRFRRLYQRGSF